MIEIDSKDLFVFEQLLKEKLDRLIIRLNFCKHSPDSHFYKNVESDYHFYLSLYDDVCAKIYNTGK